MSDAAWDVLVHKAASDAAWASPRNVERYPRLRGVDARRKVDEEFRETVVRVVRETGKPIAEAGRELGINQATGL